MAVFLEGDVSLAISESLKKLGYSGLRPLQDLVVKKFLQGKDDVFRGS